MTDTLNLRDAVALATVIHAAKTNARVHWLHEGHLMNGVARHIVNDPEHAYFLTNEDDVRDGYLRVSATFEHFLPVRDVVQMVLDGEFAVDPVPA